MEKKKEEGIQMDSPKGKAIANGESTVPKVEIEIKRHQQLFELLSKPKDMWRVLLSLFLIIVVLFWGIAFVVIAIKKYYPYHIIETNIQGATTMKSEDKEVIYWLFNTADLWANSGIEVKKGDELTIRASGASFTAIHHLVKASDENYKPNDEWVGTGGQRKDDSRDKLRAEYRINKNYDEGILLMQIIPSDSAKENNWINPYSQYLRNGPIEIIGRERRNLRISENGVLHFAVNDIVLTEYVIERMYKEWIDSLIKKGIIEEKDTEGVLSMMSALDYKGLKERNNILIQKLKDAFELRYDNEKVTLLCNKKLDGLKTRLDTLVNIFKDKNKDTVNSYSNRQDSNDLKKYIFDNIDFTKVIEEEKIGLSLGRYPKKECDSCYNAYPLINELNYYKNKQFYNAWYVDNLGSFLIVIERKKK